MLGILVALSSTVRFQQGTQTGEGNYNTVIEFVFRYISSAILVTKTLSNVMDVQYLPTDFQNQYTGYPHDLMTHSPSLITESLTPFHLINRSVLSHPC